MPLLVKRDFDVIKMHGTTINIYIYIHIYIYLLVNVVCFLLGNYPASGVYMPTFRNTLFRGTDKVFRNVGI